MESSTLPVIDWEQALRVAGNQELLAQDLMKALIKTLPADAAEIKKLGEEQNYSELLKKVHKLHGALCYSGFSRLKSVVLLLETDLKNNIMVNLTSVLQKFDSEVGLLLEHYSRLQESRNSSPA